MKVATSFLQHHTAAALKRCQTLVADLIHPCLNRSNGNQGWLTFFPRNACTRTVTLPRAREVIAAGQEVCILSNLFCLELRDRSLMGISLLISPWLVTPFQCQTPQVWGQVPLEHPLKLGVTFIWVIRNHTTLEFFAFLPSQSWVHKSIVLFLESWVTCPQIFLWSLEWLGLWGRNDCNASNGSVMTSTSWCWKPHKYKYSNKYKR